MYVVHSQTAIQHASVGLTQASANYIIPGSQCEWYDWYGCSLKHDTLTV